MIDLVVVDSVAALTPRAEIEGEMGDQFMGLQARMMGQAMRKLTAIASKSKNRHHFHQSNPDENRDYVRQSGNDSGRPGFKILLLYSD